MEKGRVKTANFEIFRPIEKWTFLENHIQASSYSVFEATDGPADPVHQMTLPSCWVE